MCSSCGAVWSFAVSWEINLAPKDRGVVNWRLLHANAHFGRKLNENGVYREYSISFNFNLLIYTFIIYFLTYKMHSEEGRLRVD